AWIALVTLIYLALTYSSKGADSPPIWLILCLLLGAGLIFSAPLCGVVSRRRRIRKIPTLNDDWVIRLSDDGMSSSIKPSEGRMDWSGFSSERRLPARLFLLQLPNPFP